jgi:hypothetical protein
MSLQKTPSPFAHGGKGDSALGRHGGVGPTLRGAWHDTRPLRSALIGLGAPGHQLQFRMFVARQNQLFLMGVPLA